MIDTLQQYRSCAVVGLEKNTGKTVTLNYILQHLPLTARAAVTSIGLDGESRDQVTGTHKPEICLREGMVFATSEKHYRQRRLCSEILFISEERTALGRLVTARVRQTGKVILSGPGSSAAIRRWMDEVKPYTDLVLVDGALSRMSVASPTVCETMVLATGAAFSANIDTLVRQTAFIAELIQLPLYEEHNSSPVVIDGAVTNRVLETLLNTGRLNGDTAEHDAELVIQDFTKVFADSMLWHRFCKQYKVFVRKRSRLLAITVNPTAPNGMVLDSDRLCQALSEATRLPVYDLKKNNPL